MGHVFISYSSKHRSLTEQLAKLLEAEGYTVWWDHALESWGSFRSQIDEALAAAAAVVVIWNEEAAASLYVQAEAGKALNAGKLVNARLPDFPPSAVPVPFNALHIDKLDLAEPHRLLRSIRGVETAKPHWTAKPHHEHYSEGFGVDLFDPKRTPLDREAAADLAPSQLLQAKHEAVDYVDATGLAEEMLAWCRNGARATAGRLVHGPGGLGKTRLMIEAAKRLRAEDWLAGFMQPPRRPDDIQEMRQREQALEQVFALGDEPGVLLIVDYAEGRQREVEDLARLLARRPLTGARPVRLVLLARGDGWWKDFYLQKEGIEPVFRLTGKPHGDVHALTPIPAGEARRDFFDRTVTAFRPGMEAMAKAGMIPRWDGQPPNQQRVIRLIREPAYARPLAIQMEAMLHLASATPEPGAQGVDVLLDKVLGVERAHWGKLLGRLDDDRLRDQNRGVAQVTAVAGVPSPEAAEGLLMADLFYQGVRTAPVHVDPVRRDLVRVYGKADGGIAHLEPDLIGEHQVASIGDVQLIEGCLTWIEAGSQPERAKRRRDLITVLQRATQPEHGAHVAAQASALLDHMVRGRMASLAGDIVAVMADTPGRLREVVESALDALDAEGLVALDGALPLMHLQLLELALEVSQRHVQAAQAQLARAEADAVAPERLEAARSAYAKRGRSARQPSLRSGAARGGAQRQRGGGGHQKAAGRDPPRGLPARSGEQPRHSQRRPLWPWAPRGGASGAAGRGRHQGAARTSSTGRRSPREGVAAVG